MKSYSGIPLICKMLKTMMPAVDRELDRWRQLAERIPNTELKVQALASIEKKRFHCVGGGVYALYPGAGFAGAIKFIVAFQTISDYLDNLCDRAGVQDEKAFRQLHLAMADAVDPHAPLHNYYKLYPSKDDKGYLESLVAYCRKVVEKLPSYEIVLERMRWLVSLYAELQVLKHGPTGLRGNKLRQWAAPLEALYPGITTWEYCAAAGSTLGVFLLFAAAQRPGVTTSEAEALLSAYFPWICGLHILLDYFIDAEEDRKEGDFNFTSYYTSAEECCGRLSHFIGQSLHKCAGLEYGGFHETVVRGLLAMYLSDAKALNSTNGRISKRLIRLGGRKAMLYWNACRALRALGKL
jgi:tetraprenyl-beta-curcumene synthase